MRVHQRFLLWLGADRSAPTREAASSVQVPGCPAVACIVSGVERAMYPLLPYAPAPAAQRARWLNLWKFQWRSPADPRHKCWRWYNCCCDIIVVVVHLLFCAECRYLLSEYSTRVHALRICVRVSSWGVLLRRSMFGFYSAGLSLCLRRAAWVEYLGHLCVWSRIRDCVAHLCRC